MINLSPDINLLAGKSEQ